jgi:hypothetical protein
MAPPVGLNVTAGATRELALSEAALAAREAAREASNAARAGNVVDAAHASARATRRAAAAVRMAADVAGRGFVAMSARALREATAAADAADMAAHAAVVAGTSARKPGATLSSAGPACLAARVAAHEAAESAQVAADVVARMAHAATDAVTLPAAARDSWVRSRSRTRGEPKVALAVLRLAVVLLPQPARAIRVEEWRGELAHLTDGERRRFIWQLLPGIPALTLIERWYAARKTMDGWRTRRWLARRSP